MIKKIITMIYSGYQDSCRSFVDLYFFLLSIKLVSLTCGMMVSRDRRSCSPIAAISKPSIRIRPPALSRIRNKAKVRVDLPAPVRPTIPTCFSRKKEGL